MTACPPRKAALLFGIVRLSVVFSLALIFGCQPQHQLPDSIGISVPYEPDTLDPHVTSTISSLSISSNFYEPLVSTDANMKLQPCLASHWENPDPVSWVFHLQPSVVFHNGKPMRAEDVVFTFERLLHSQDLAVAALITEVSEVAAIDPLTVRIRTRVPVSIFLNKISFVMIVPRGSTSETLAAKVEGTGPYMLAGWQKGKIIQLTRNEHYWRGIAGIPRVTYYLSRSPDEAIQDLVSERCRLALCNSKQLKDVVQKLGHFDLKLHDSLSLKYLAFDMSRDDTPDCPVRPNPLKKKSVREAIHLALDRQKLIAGLANFAAPASQIVPPFVFGYNSEIKPPPCQLDRARKLLAEAGLPGGFDVTLLARQILSDAAVEIRQQLRQVGIRVSIKSVPDPDFFVLVNNRRVSFFLSKLSTTTGDASDVLEAALHSTDVSGHFGVYNWGSYSNPQVDESIERSTAILNVEDRRAALEKIMTLAMDDLPWSPLYVDQEVYAVDNSFSWQPRNDGLVLAYEIKLRHP